MTCYSAMMLRWLILIIILQYVTGAKIIGIFPFPSRSHMAVNNALMKGLARKGHEVTVVSPFALTAPIPNYKNIKIIELDLMKKIDTDSMFESNKLQGFLSKLTFIWDLGNYLCDTILQTEELQHLIHSKDLTFDLVVTEAFIMDCFVGFSHKFKAPLVQTCSFDGSSYISSWMGNPHPISHIPDGMQAFSDKMNFVQRFQNALGNVVMRLTREIFFIPQQNAIMRRYFNYTDELPHMSDILYSTSLILQNGHFSIGYPKPLTPNIIQVGGMHVEPPKKLPKDVQDFLDSAPDGVIFFSMGSNLKASDLPETTRKTILDVFSKLKLKVLCKWETESLPGQPSNVKLGKWLPQSDILAHPNIRLFITHGGLLSSQETIHRGIPVVGIPIFADQHFNMARAVSAGYGVLLEYQNITEESLSRAINEILTNPSYHENARRHSRIYRDQPLTPLEQAVFWTEYVIRHKGAPHMRSAALDLTWYQYFLLDVMAVFLLAIVSVLSVIYFALRTLFRKCFGSSKRITSKPSKKKRN